MVVHRIHVTYPCGPDERIVLRTARDWSADVAPVAVDAARTRFTFEVPWTSTTLPFKPCLASGDGAPAWSEGWNHTARAGTEREVYPCFHSGPTGTITRRITVPGTTRQIGVYLPPGYTENTLKRYPVVYMQDGANLLQPGPDGQDWSIDDALDVLVALGSIDKLIVVALYTRDRNEYADPGYADYAATVVGDVIPFVDATFRTLRGPEHRSVAGSSLGGLVSLYLAWNHPDVFGHAVCLSPTLWAGEGLLRQVDASTAEDRPTIRIYLDSGFPRDNALDTRVLYEQLAQRGWRYGEDLLYFLVPMASHSEAYWALRWHLPFQYVLRRAMG